ncbi:hypothetical protein EV363DRAFT_1178050, partial [Boletus edulis]
YRTTVSSLSYSRKNVGLLMQCAPYIKVGFNWARKYYQRMGQTHAYNAEISATGAGQVCFHATLALRYYGVTTLRVREPSQSVPQAVNQEFNACILSVLSPEGTHPLAFWEVRLIICICRLHSAVPCERVFSSSSETNTKKHNHIAPLLMEALQMLKFWLKKDHLNFTKDWVTPQKDMISNEDNDDDLLARLFSTTNKSSLDNILSAIAREEGDEISGPTVVFH